MPVIMEQATILALHKTVLTWYKDNGRHDLPWRNLTKYGFAVPYGVMVSEVMLQQTQVDRVEPKFLAFMKTFPTIQKLAGARPAKVITLWSGLGYNRRAIMLQRAAQVITEQYKGIVPSEVVLLKSLPGIGDYTAAAIAAFGYNEPVAVLDTNIERFYELLFWGYTKPKPAEAREFTAQFIPKEQSRDWHSALMDIMTVVRKAKTPLLQQALLVKELNLKPKWVLPKLKDEPLKRPKQSKFHHSPRYYRGRIIAFLKERPDHKATFHQVEDYIHSLAMPSNYSLLELLEQLKKDGLITYKTPLRARSIIAFP